MTKRCTFNHLYAIFTYGGGIREFLKTDGNIMKEHVEGELVVHQDDDEKIWAIVFEDTDTAEQVKQTYIDQTGDYTVLVKPTLATSIDVDHNFRLYRYDGEWEDITHADYIERMIVD